MKTKLAIVLVISAAFVAGYFLGCDQTKKSMRQSIMRNHLFWHRVYSSHELDRVVLILTQFREGNPTNGVTMLEKCLDGSLIAAAASDADLKDSTGGIPTYIQEAHEYRAKYPWTNSVPEVDAKVRKILSRAK
jgi:aspartyl/asparaginyl beta-hydroxylase (cupin superfamily)